MRKQVVVLPKTQRILSTLGEQIRLARLRRNLSMQVISERAQITRPTLTKVERGAPDVAIGIYAKVLMALGNMDNDLLLIAKDDVVGRTYRELNMTVNKRSRRL